VKDASFAYSGDEDFLRQPLLYSGRTKRGYLELRPGDQAGQRLLLRTGVVR
jgi:hypothetical protein